MNGGHQRVDGTVQAIGGDLAFESPSDLSNRVMPMSAVGGQVEQADARVLSHPGRNCPGFVDAGVVEDQQQGLARIRPQKLLQEGDELAGPLALRDLIPPASRIPVQRPEDGPLAIRAWSEHLFLLAAPHPHRAQDRQQMHIGLIQAQHEGFLGRVHDAVAHLPHDAGGGRIHRQEVARASPPIAQSMQHAAHGRRTDVDPTPAGQMSSQRRGGPTIEPLSALGWWPLDPVADQRTGGRVRLARPLRSRAVPQPHVSFRLEAICATE